MKTPAEADYSEQRATTNTMGLGFTLVQDFDLWEKKNWLVEGLLGEGDLSAFFGEPGATKSVLAVDLACHVALGRPWFGREVKQSGVLYIACERGGTIRRRIRAFLENDAEQLSDQTYDIPLAVPTRRSTYAPEKALKAFAGQSGKLPTLCKRRTSTTASSKLTW